MSCNNTISIFHNSFATNSGHGIDASSIILRKLDDWLQRSKIWRNVKARNHLLCLLVFNGFLVLSYYASEWSAWSSHHTRIIWSKNVQFAIEISNKLFLTIESVRSSVLVNTWLNKCRLYNLFLNINVINTSKLRNESQYFWNVYLLEIF